MLPAVQLQFNGSRQALVVTEGASMQLTVEKVGQVEGNISIIVDAFGSATPGTLNFNE